MQYLEEVMNSGSFKLLLGHIVANGDNFISERLVEFLPNQIFAFKESHRASVSRLRRVNTRMSKSSTSSRLGHGCGVVKNHDRRNGHRQMVNLLLLIALTTRKASSIHLLGYCLLPLQQSKRDELYSGQD